jgi:hypothetical protein
MAIERVTSPPPRNPRAALDTLAPTPNIPLLSAHEAKEKLREIIEGFFFRRRNDQGQAPARHVLVRSPPGLGKIREAIHWAIRYHLR